MAVGALLRVAALAITWVVSPHAFAADSFLMIQRFGDELIGAPVHGAISPLRCVVTLLDGFITNQEQLKLQFGGIYRPVEEDQLALLHKSERTALEEMAKRGVIKPGDVDFYLRSTDEIPPEQITFIDQMALAPEGYKGEVIPLDGKPYRRSALLRLVSGQEPAQVAAGGKSISRFKAHPLPWMRQYQKYWKNNSSQFKDMKFSFELGRAAALDEGNIETNLKLATWVAARETLAFTDLNTLRSTPRYLDNAVVFVHSTNPTNTRLYKSPKYGFRELPGHPGTDPNHKILWISLQDLFDKFPPQASFPDVAATMETLKIRTPLEALKLTEDSITYRSTFLESKKGFVAEIHDRTAAAQYRLFGDFPGADKQMQFYRLAEQSILGRPLSYEEKLIQLGILPAPTTISGINSLPELRTSRIWWVPRSASPGNATTANVDDAIRELFQVSEYYEKEFSTHFQPQVAAQEVQKTSLFTLAFSDIPVEILQKKGIPVFLEAKGKKVVRLSFEQIEKLKKTYPDLAKAGQKDPLGISILDFKKRLLTPAIDPKFKL